MSIFKKGSNLKEIMLFLAILFFLDNTTYGSSDNISYSTKQFQRRKLRPSLLFCQPAPKPPLGKIHPPKEIQALKGSLSNVGKEDIIISIEGSLKFDLQKELIIAQNAYTVEELGRLDEVVPGKYWYPLSGDTAWEVFQKFKIDFDQAKNLMGTLAFSEFERLLMSSNLGIFEIIKNSYDAIMEKFFMGGEFFSIPEINYRIDLFHSYFRVEVEDNGIGMNSTLQPYESGQKVFQYEGLRYKLLRGTGGGLMSFKGPIYALGGEYSVINKGENMGVIIRAIVPYLGQVEPVDIQKKGVPVIKHSL